MSDSDILQDISDDLRYLIKCTVPNSVYKNEESPGGDMTKHSITCSIWDSETSKFIDIEDSVYEAVKNEGHTAYEKGSGSAITEAYPGSVIWCDTYEDDEHNFYYPAYLLELDDDSEYGTCTIAEIGTQEMLSAVMPNCDVIVMYASS